MTARSARLAGPLAIVGTDPVDVFTAAPGMVALAHSLRIVNVTADPVTFDVCLNVHDPAHALFWRATIAGRTVLTDDTRCVLEPDDVLIVKADVSSALTVHLSGAELHA